MICYKMWPYEIDIYSCKGFDTSWIASSNQNVMICETALGMIGDSSLRLFRARSMTRWSNFTSKTAWHGFRWMNSNWIISQIKHFMVLRGRKHGFFGIAPRETTRQTRVVFCSGKGTGQSQIWWNVFRKITWTQCLDPSVWLAIHPWQNCLSGGSFQPLYWYWFQVFLIFGWFFSHLFQLDITQISNLIENRTIQLQFCCCQGPRSCFSSRFGKKKLLFLGSMLGTILDDIFSSYHPNLSKFGSTPDITYNII